MNINGKTLETLKGISIHASLEAMPRSFNVNYISENSTSNQPLGSSVQIGTKNNGILFSAVMEKREQNLTAADHSMQMAGRSIVKDLIDGSANVRNSQLPSQINMIAKFLCDDRGVKWKNLSQSNNNQNLSGILNVGVNESPFAILERAARYESKIIYDSWDGKFIINDVATSTITNITEDMCTVINFNESIDHRFYSYAVVRSPNSVAVPAGDAVIVDGLAYDPNKSQISPGRTMTIINPKNDGSYDFSQRLAEWYANRSYGKSLSLDLTIPSWVYKTGSFWDINTLVSVEIPGIYQTSKTGKPLLISELTMAFSEQAGTTTSLHLVYPEAFQPEPFAISPSTATNMGNPNPSLQSGSYSNG
ncbi:hypothetical protein [Gluconacetobacter diazotrophicus]|uniref:hypothetical protein n=1 Tax=Gluconacetobacter diazotrophicus TaxID=33996 RepID=UPI0011A826EC|nr:hypothetical protein [Gluconacetobacter diazotrophicus]